MENIYDKYHRLRKTTLHSCRFVTRQNHENKKNHVKTAWLGGTNFWSELETPRVIMDVFAHMTEEEFARIKERAYGLATEKA